MFRSGSRTRDRQIRNLLLYPLSYPVVDEPESNRRPAAFAAALPLSYRPLAKHPRTASGIRHGSAARTGRVLEPAPLDTVRSMLRIDASSKAPIPCARRIRPPPVPSIRAQRFMLSNSSASQRSVPLHGQSMPGCFGMRIDRAKNRRNLRLRTRKSKTPPAWSPRAFAFLGDRGDRSPRRGISRWVGCRVEAGLPVARTAARRAGRVRHVAGCLCGSGLSCRFVC